MAFLRRSSARAAIAVARRVPDVAGFAPRSGTFRQDRVIGRGNHCHVLAGNWHVQRWLPVTMTAPRHERHGVGVWLSVAAIMGAVFAVITRASPSLSLNILTSGDSSEYLVRFHPSAPLRTSRGIPAEMAPGKPQWRPIRLSRVVQFGASASNFPPALSCRHGPLLRCVDVVAGYNLGELPASGLPTGGRSWLQVSRRVFSMESRSGTVANEIRFARALAVISAQSDAARQGGNEAAVWPDVLVGSRTI